MVGRKGINEVRRKLALFKDRLDREGIDNAKYILFGSWAKGTPHKFSDIDVCVVSDKFSGNAFEDSTKLRLLTIGIDDLLEPVAMRPEDLKDKYSTLAAEINKYGVSLKL